jgi:hypothetical protein
VVTRWHPPFDLLHLIEALSEEILTATDEEVRQAFSAHGRNLVNTARERNLASAVREVKLLVENACAEADEVVARNLNEGRAKDLDDDPIGPGAGPQPAGAPRRPSHHQRH